MTEMIELELWVTPDTLQRVKEVVETWDIHRKDRRGFNAVDMRKFVEAMNDRTKQIIRLVRREDVSFYQAVANTSNNAANWLAWVVSSDAQPSPLTDAQAEIVRPFIRAFNTDSQDFYTALTELCVNAQTQLTPGARLMADGINRTDV